MSDIERTIDALLSEDRLFAPPTGFRARALVGDAGIYMARGRPLGDVTTLANAEIVEQIRDMASASAGDE